MHSRHLKHNDHPQWVCIYLRAPILNMKSHMLWLLCSACFLHHKHVLNTKRLVSFLAWHISFTHQCMLNTKRYQHWCLFMLGTLSCISDARWAQKDISIGLFLCLVPFLHPWCMPSTNTHHVSVFSCLAHLLHSLKHTKHENTLVFMFSAFSTC